MSSPTPSAPALLHLTQPPREPSDRPPLLILLHGYGSNEQDLFGLAPYVDPRLLVVSVRAPHMLSAGSYAWFQITWTATGSVMLEPEQAERSRQLLLDFIPAITAKTGADPARVYLGGFSQGAIMSSLVALTEPELIAGTVLMSGRVPDDVRPLLASNERLEGKPFLVTHGTADTVLPIHNGRASRALLSSLPVALTYKEYPMAHEINAQCLDDVTSWLTAELGA